MIHFAKGYKNAGLLLACAFLLATTPACSKKNKAEEAMKTSIDLPKDIEDRFAVKDVSEMPVASAAPAPAPSPSPTPVSKKSKSKKGKKEEAALTATQAVAVDGTTTGLQKIPQSRRPAVDRVWVGEKHSFEVTYFGVPGGSVTLEILPYKAVANRKVYHIKGQAKSSSMFSLFYRVDDSVESFWDFESLFSHRFHLVLDETKQKRDNLELNDFEKAKTYFWNKWDHVTKGYSETKETNDIPQYAQDSVSALYYLRTLPLEPGGVYSVPVVSEGKFWEAVINVERREMIDTPMGRKSAIVVRPETKFKGVLEKKGDSFIWITDDERRAIVRIEGKVKIGTVVAKLLSFEPGKAP